MALPHQMHSLAVFLRPYRLTLFVATLVSAGIVGCSWWLLINTTKNVLVVVSVFVSTYLSLWAAGLLHVSFQHIKEKDSYGIGDWSASIFDLFWFAFLIIYPFFGIYVYLFHRS